MLETYYADETDSANAEAFYPLTLAGSMLVYDVLKGGSDRYGNKYAPSVSRVLVRDLSTGRVLHRVPSSSYRQSEDIGFGVPLATVAKPDGAVAWIAHSGNHGLPLYELWEADSTGPRLLASGTDITPDSLALAGGVLYWMQAGEARTARLR